jgi:1-deoxy-D-xylulose-5-phosphate synthase
MCDAALKMRDLLLKKGIVASVLDPVFIKPLDADLLSHLLMKHQRIVTLEEHSLRGGFGSEVNHFLMTHGFTGCQVLNFGIPEIFLDHSDHLHDESGLTAPKMTQKILTHFSFPSAVASRT